jgi:hypothetical protein
MAARVNGPAGDGVAAEISDQEPAQAPPPPPLGSPTASSVDMELTGPSARSLSLSLMPVAALCKLCKLPAAARHAERRLCSLLAQLIST